MKRAALFLLITVLVVSFTGVCLAAGKVAIVTNTVSQNEEEFRAGEEMKAKYGDRIVHVTWPDNFMTEQEQMVSIVTRMAADPDVKALIMNQAVPGTNAAVDKLLEIRDDVFIVYVNPQENPPDVAARAHVVLQIDQPETGNTIPTQAHKMGAKTFVHYSFPRHMSQPLLSNRRSIMKQKCEELGLEFVDATAPDPTGDLGIPGAQQFILEDVPKMVAKYGTDTAFFATNCSMQIPLIKAVLDTRAIYPIPCCPSPFHGFPIALGLESSREDALARTSENVKYVIEETKKAAAVKGATGRLSNWPVPIGMMITAGTTEYALKIMNGEISLDKLDKVILEELLSDYAGVNISLAPLVNSGKEIPNFLLTLMDFITY